ncbi:MAG: zinc-dependent alcohol dehydrogenase family protein [candidate division KSB1 bacterium]|nr:zinc-dependent alcohol dehydrogenase family protein [candidate division KSB1 bacterium]
MRAVVIQGPGRASVEQVPDPVPGPGELLVKVKACGLCGTDVHLFRGVYLGTYPLIPGHEASGEVMALGPGVSGFAPGDRVAIEPNIACGTCRFCLSNQQNFCSSWSAVGVTRPGAMAEYVVAPAQNCFPIGSLPYEEAAFMEPLSCILHGLQQVTVEPGDHVLLLGAGPIGLLLLHALFSTGATEVTVVERTPRRREMAAQLGARVFANLSPELRAMGEADHFDLVVEATGDPALISECIRLARKGGRVLLFGVPPADSTATIEPFQIFRKGLRIVSSYTSRRNSLAALRLLQGGRVQTQHLVTHRLPLEQFPQGVQLLDRPEHVLKVMFNPELLPV